MGGHRVNRKSQIVNQKMEYRKSPCKECGNNLEYPPALAGTTIVCPHCGQWTELVAPEKPAKRAKSRRVFALGSAVLASAVMAIWLHHSRQQGVPRAVEAMPKVATNPPVATMTAPLTESTPSKPGPKSSADLKVGEVKLEKTPGNSLVFAVGTVTNDSGWQRFAVKVDLDLINLKGRIIGRTQDQKAIIEPHQAWQFRALIPDSQAVAAKVAMITEEK